MAVKFGVAAWILIFAAAFCASLDWMPGLWLSVIAALGCSVAASTAERRGWR